MRKEHMKNNVGGFANSVIHDSIVTPYDAIIFVNIISDNGG